MQGPKNGVIVMMAAPVVFASRRLSAVSFMALNAITKHLQPREGRRPQFCRQAAKCYFGGSLGASHLELQS